jgi:hypothetical protein
VFAGAGVFSSCLPALFVTGPSGAGIINLADIKESNPVEVAEYAATKILLDTTGFIWWAPHVLQKRTIMSAAVTKRYHKRTRKFGIEVPKSWYDCVKLDKENDNTL